MNPEAAPLVVVDLDGVLADVRHRVHHVERRPKDWDAFFAAAIDDPVLPDGAAHVQAAMADGADIVYLTGRPERCRADTLVWLARHGLPAAALHMRPDRDRRPARMFKVDRLRHLARTRTIAHLVDDDAAVVAAVRAAGFTVVHATWMDGGTDGVDGALAQAQEVDGRT